MVEMTPSRPRTIGWTLGLAVLAAPRLASPQAAIPTTLDSAGRVGAHSSIATGSDGLGLISYYDETNTALKVAHCANVECSTATLTTLDAAGDVGEFTSLTIGGDGLGLISYYDRSNGDLKVAHCANVACTAASIRTVDPAPEDVGLFTHIVTGSDGLGLIGYARGQNGAGLKIAHCANADCSAATVTTLAGAAEKGAIDLIVGTDGRGLLVHVDTSLVRAVHCEDLACATVTTSTLAPASLLTFDDPPAALGRGANGLGMVAYWQPVGDLAVPRFGTCTDVPCSSLALSTAVRAFGSPIVVGNDGFPLMGFGGLGVLDCLDAGCVSSRRNRFDLLDDVQPSIAMGSDQRPLVSYWNAASGDLKVAHCFEPDCGGAGADLEGGSGFVEPEGPFALGGEVRIRYFVGNRGPDPSPETRLRVALPAGLTFVSSTPGTPTCRFEAPDLVCDVGTLMPFTQFQMTLTGVLSVPGPAILTATGTVSGAAYDVDPTNTGGTVEIHVRPLCSIDSDVAVPEGDSGTSDAVFTVRRASALTSEDRVGYQVLAGTATTGVDYVPDAGVLTFPPGQETATLTARIIGDLVPEPDETVRIVLAYDGAACAPGATTAAIATIVDDDSPSLSTREVEHGSMSWHTVTAGGSPATDLFRLRQAPYASYEVAVDGASGDLLPFAVERLAADNSTILSSSAATRSAAAIRWENDSVVTIDNQHLRVRSTGCASGCGADDAYRLRVYETTLAGPRFNNASGQVSLVILQNVSDEPITGHVRFWSAAGALAGSWPIAVAPRASLVVDTNQVPGAAGTSGSLTVGHDGVYGALAGKVVALQPATGFSFDAPLASRPR